MLSLPVLMGRVFGAALLGWMSIQATEVGFPLLGVLLAALAAMVFFFGLEWARALRRRFRP